MEKLDSTPALTVPTAWKVLGQPLPAVHGREIVTGAHLYATDVVVPGMWHGVVVRPPGPGARLLSLEAPSKPGARLVREGDFVGVVAEDRATAASAAAALRARWSYQPPPALPQLLEKFRRESQPPQPQPEARYPPLIQRGDVRAALAAAPARSEAAYSLPYIAHAPLEPRCAIAEWSGDGASLTVRCATQAPFLTRKELAGAFRLPEDRVRVIALDIGGAFGSKQRAECALEAARLAREAGRPVRVAWTREEEFAWSYARPAGLVEVQAGYTPAGKIQAWQFRNYNSGAPGLAVPYAIPHYSCEFHRAESPIRQGSYRSLAAVANNFARETQIDELAQALRLDPLEMRLRNLEDQRLRTVLQRAAERFGWRRARSANGTGFGLSCNLEKEGRLALFVELEADARRARLRRFVAACDFGAILNPDNLRHQVTGALIQGIGGALFERLDFGPEGVRNRNFSSYRVPRFSDVPEIEVILEDRRDIDPAGAGEAAITLPAPAIGNAVFAATGRRLRSLPLGPGLG